LHVLVLLAFSTKRTALRPLTQRLSDIYFVPDPEPGSPLAEVLSLQDPRVFFRLEAQSFSRMNSLAQSRFSHELMNRTQPYRWLAPSEQYWAANFHRYVGGAVRRSAVLTEKMPPTLSDVPSSKPALPAHALLQIEGDLAGRRLLSNLPLPANESSAILTNTVIRIVVDAAGQTLWAALMFGSGSPKADQSALAFAKQVRFESMTAPGHESESAGAREHAFGQLVFQWFPAAPGATNQTTAKP
jgi:hypothetical protein